MKKNSNWFIDFKKKKKTCLDYVNSDFHLIDEVY